MIAPPLFIFEGVSAIRANVTRKQITLPVADRAFQEFMIAIERIRLLTQPNSHQRAWEIAKQYSQSQAYDAHYLALAESQSCEFWTADSKLFNSLKNILPWVKYLTYSNFRIT